MSGPSTSGKNKKYGRMRAMCEIYRREGKREKNKMRKLRTRLKAHPNDKAAEAAIDKLSRGLRPLAFGGRA